jgi:hypothetical protein
MNNVKPRLYMKKMRPRAAQEQFGVGEKRRSLPLDWLMKLIESFEL